MPWRFHHPGSGGPPVTVSAARDNSCASGYPIREKREHVTFQPDSITCHRKIRPSGYSVYGRLRTEPWGRLIRLAERPAVGKRRVPMPESSDSIARGDEAVATPGSARGRQDPDVRIRLLGLRIAAQHLDEAAMISQKGNGFGNLRFVRMSIAVDEEEILPGLPLAGT